MSQAAPDLISTDDTLDTIGHYCPMPIIFTVKRMKRLEVGQVLLVLSNDPGILKDMPAWCSAAGQGLLKMDEDQGIYRCYVKKLK